MRSETMAFRLLGVPLRICPIHHIHIVQQSFNKRKKCTDSTQTSIFCKNYIWVIAIISNKDFGHDSVPVLVVQLKERE